MPFFPSVRTSFAPYAFINNLLSTDIVSGIVTIILYPLAADKAARPIPVFPEVGSIIVPPFLRRPLLSASCIMKRAILSLAEPAGLKYSSFASIVALRLFFFIKFESFMRGVFPIKLSKELYIFIA